MNNTKLWINDGDLYDKVSSYRQEQDVDWIVSLFPKEEYNNYIDIGCGSGSLMRKMLKEHNIKNVTGLEGSESRLKEAKNKLKGFDNVNKTYYLKDILEYPKFNLKFDAITMTSVLHWLYPYEDKVFEWIDGMFDDKGILCLTTYHPNDTINGIGGTDKIVIEAYNKIGVDYNLFGKLDLIGKRTRDIVSIEKLINQIFEIHFSKNKQANMTVDCEQQYIDYHIATFGGFYTQFIPSKKLAKFYENIGKIAMKRMEEYGFVTSIEVRAWYCTKK